MTDPPISDQREIRALDIKYMLSFIVGIVFGVRAVHLHLAPFARWRWFSQVAFKSVKRRWETKRFNVGAGCTRQTLHLHDYISTCDLESIFTPSSLARLDSTSAAAFGMEALARMVGKCRGSAAGLGAWVWLGRCCSRSLKPPGRYFRNGASGCQKEPLLI